MFKFVFKRFIYALLSLFIITTLSFFIIVAKPGDPIAAKVAKLPETSRVLMEAKYGLDKPLPVRYTNYLRDLLKFGELGESIIYNGRNVNMLIKQSAVVSGKIGGIAVACQVVIGVFLGMISGLARGRYTDQVIRILVVLAICIPSFVFCNLLQYYIAFKWKLTPLLGWGKPMHYVLPVMAYAIPGIATYTKYMRSSTVSVLGEDYIETARAKGVGQMRLVFRHIFRNAILPIVTMVPVAIGGIFSGAMVIETFFSIPGMGQPYVKAVMDSDSMMILGMTIFFAFTYIISLFFVDVLYGLVDPRIRITGEEK